MAKRPIYQAGPSPEPFAITPGTPFGVDAFIYVGVGGDVSVKTRGGVDVLYKNVPSGGYIWAMCSQVNSGGATTATNMVGHP